MNTSIPTPLYTHVSVISPKTGVPFRMTKFRPWSRTHSQVLSHPSHSLFHSTVTSCPKLVLMLTKFCPQFKCSSTMTSFHQYSTLTLSYQVCVTATTWIIQVSHTNHLCSIPGKSIHTIKYNYMHFSKNFRVFCISTFL